MSAATTSAAGRLTDAELKAQEKAARKAEKARQKRIAADEAAERKRSAKAGAPSRFSCSASRSASG